MPLITQMQHGNISNSNKTKCHLKVIKMSSELRLLADHYWFPNGCILTKMNSAGVSLDADNVENWSWWFSGLSQNKVHGLLLSMCPIEKVYMLLKPFPVKKIYLFTTGKPHTFTASVISDHPRS